MQFPISREGLQNFNREAAHEKRQKEQRYDFYRTLITHICGEVENGMMPFQILPQNSPDFIRHQAMLKDKQYVWKDIGILGNWGIFINPHQDMQRYGGLMGYYKSNNMRNRPVNAEQFNQSLPEFIEMLKETFIGCDIIVDPLKTYLIIDWS